MCLINSSMLKNAILLIVWINNENSVVYRKTNIIMLNRLLKNEQKTYIKKFTCFLFFQIMVLISFMLSLIASSGDSMMKVIIYQFILTYFAYKKPLIFVYFASHWIRWIFWGINYFLGKRRDNSKYQLKMALIS